MNENNFLDRLWRKIRQIFGKKKKALCENNEIKMPSKLEEKIDLPTKLDGTKDFSVIFSLIKKYESKQIRESELTEEEICLLEMYYVQKNMELAKKVECHLKKIEKLKQKLRTNM